jgi:hypothetical protein
MRYRYDINRGMQKIKTKTFIAISTLGLILGGGAVSLAVFGTAHASSPGLWKLHAPSALTFSCGGSPYAHTLNTVSENQSGAFTGTGTYNSDPSYTWTASGSVSGNTISFSILYTGTAAGSVYNLAGTIASDGSISGTVDNNCQTFSMPAGTATFFSIKDFDADKNLRPKDCSLTKSSKEVVDVSYKLVNDYDSAVGGNAWANDTIHRDLSIWNVSGNTYCAIVNDDGSFVTFAGASPNGTGTVGAGVKGEMDGGYRTVLFTGDFIGKTNYKTHGHLGTFDLACGPSTAPSYECNGPHPSYVSYFSNDVSNVDLAWWGWQYNTCQNGDWVNSIDANIGDITGTAPLHQNKKCSDDNDRHHHDKDKHHDRDFDNDDHHHVGPRA